ncbi:MAG: nucleotidyltransferase [Candidatus Frackibacter sp. T328-2]|nr:MAG: nucleotidyltransferase [Candidatus Frackibacter sp. T328-2]
MRTEILSELNKMEKEEEVKILYAVESGSRAWGFPSKDSDYDVRFIYLRPVEWYLSIDKKRDVLEYPINNKLDISGWDLKKALYLFKKSNPALIEWLFSAIVYIERYSAINRLRELNDKYFSIKSSIYHYLNMARGNYKDYLQGDEVKIKKYFYVLRPVLACKWLEANKTAVPMNFEELLDSQVSDMHLYKEIKELLKRKRAGEELDIEPKIDIINNFIEEEFAYYEEYARGIEDIDSVSYEELNKLFRNTLDKVFGVI